MQQRRRCSTGSRSNGKVAQLRSCIATNAVSQFAGTEVEASPIGGRGFSVEKAGPDAASHVFIFATGSGISPIKALIESGALQVGPFCWPCYCEPSK